MCSNYRRMGHQGIGTLFHQGSCMALGRDRIPNSHFSIYITGQELLLSWWLQELGASQKLNLETSVVLCHGRD